MIGDEGEQIGVMPPFEALKLARSKNLDLVEISPTAQPPVCRIMDYGKYLYQQEKKEREAKKHQKTITVKEVKFRINVDDHDYETKKNHVLRFLDGGDKVKATIFFRGREMTRTGLGRQILERLIKDVEPHSIVEFRPRQEGNTLHAILAPKKTAVEREKEREREAKQKAKQEKKLAQEKEKPAPEKPCQQKREAASAGRSRRGSESSFAGLAAKIDTKELTAGNWRPAADLRGTYAEIENAQRRCQALQENCHGQGEARTFRPSPHADVQGQETQTQTGHSHAGERRRSPQSKADDSVSVRL